jgi:hypothetical protein
VNNRGFALLLLLVGGAALPGFAPGVKAQAAPIGILLGYGPSTLTGLSGTSPVYTYGDQLWMLSQLQSSVGVVVQPLVLTPGTSRAINVTLEPGLPTLIHTFNASDPLGYWGVSEANSSMEPVFFILSSAPRLPLSVTGYRLGGSGLTTSLNTNGSVGFYQAEACTLGSASPEVAALPIPPEDGGGTMSLDFGKASVNVTAQEAGNQTFNFWLELYYPFSHTQAAVGAFVAQDLRTVESASGSFAGPRSGADLPLASDMPPRPGRYDLRAYFDGPGGLSVERTPMLRTYDGSWVWLGSCQGGPVASASFSVTSGIGSDPAGWPRTLYFMYRVGGVEGYAEKALDVNISRVDFLGVPWGVDLPSYSLLASPGSGVSALQVVNRTVLVILDGEQGFLNYSLGLGNQTFFSGSLGPLTPFSEDVLQENVSRLQVTLLLSGSAVGDGTVSVSNAGGPLLSLGIDRSGNAMFYLPAGTYQVNGSAGNRTASESVNIALGESAQISLDVAASSASPDYTLYALWCAAAVGVALNMFLWLRGRGLLRRAQLSS